MTLAAVGERAGYSRGLVTARFGSKDQLLAALVDRITAGWSHRNVLPRTVGQPGRDGILILIDAIRAQAERDPRALRTLYALMFEALGPNVSLRQHFVEFHRTMRADLAKLVRRGLRDGSVAAPSPTGRRGDAGGRRAARHRLPMATRPRRLRPVPPRCGCLADATDQRLRP